MPLNITYQDRATTDDTTAIDAWLPGVISTPSGSTWDAKVSGSQYNARDTANNYVVFVPITGTPAEIGLGHRESDGSAPRLLGSADGEDFTTLQSHLAGLV